MGILAAATSSIITSIRGAMRRTAETSAGLDRDAHEIGAIGEAATEAVLAPLRTHGYVLLHDRGTGIVGHHENIDHILVGPAGVFVVETKKYAANRRFSTRAGTLFVDGQSTDFIAQVKRQVAVVSGAIGDRRPVRGVIVVHGAKLARDPMSAGGITVMTVSKLLGQLERSPALIAPNEVDRLTKSLRRTLPPASSAQTSVSHRPARRRSLPKGAAGTRCPSCKRGTLVLRRGDFPDFLGCSSYHTGLCRYMARPT